MAHLDQKVCQVPAGHPALLGLLENRALKELWENQVQQEIVAGQGIRGNPDKLDLVDHQVPWELQGKTE